MILPVTEITPCFKGMRSLQSATNQDLSMKKQSIFHKGKDELPKKKDFNTAKLINIGFTAAVLGLFLLAAFLTPSTGNGIKGKIKPPKK
ncbi:MAG: hypothetical protein PHE78_08010 [Candidatus Gastranaerophilales bacterium]|nr:hypothetical protein [Candidatus Gastranaerophilales bacterium]